MLQVGDQVFVEKSAREDVGFIAWSYVESHPTATVKQRMELSNVVPESETVYALEWPEEFSGGHYCQGTTANKRGQFVAAKHLSLCFEASREVNTVPHVDTKENNL